MERRPLIGITTHGRDQRGRFRVDARYVDAVRRAGGVPLLLPPGESELEPLVALLDGLVLTGGGDVDPAHYGGTPHAEIDEVDPERDTTELALARAADRSGLPTFGVCRGAQVLNVALGGTLVEHLPDEVGDEVSHRPEPGAHAFERHAVEIEPGSRLAAILDTARCAPPSWHHQAVRTLAPGLEVVARSPDAAVEAFEKPGHPWLLGVQWHPEVTAAIDPVQQRLFDALVAAARGRRRGHRLWTGSSS